MLIYDSNYLFQIGFQLSFLAVLSILIFYKPLYKFLKPKSKFIDYLWSMLCISLAVQVLIFPISIFNFHYFSTVFALSNFVVLPLAFLVLCFLIIIIISHFLTPFLTHFISDILFNVTAIFYKLLQKVEALPQSGIEHIWLSHNQIIVIYLNIAILSFLMFKRKRSLGLSLIVCAILVVLTTQYQYTIRYKRNSVTFYNTHKKLSFDAFIHEYRFSLPDDSTTYSNKNYRSFMNSKQILHLCRDTFYIDQYILHQSFIKSPTTQIALSKDGLRPSISDFFLISSLSDTTLMNNENYKEIKYILPSHLRARIRYKLIEHMSKRHVKYHDLKDSSQTIEL